MIWIVQAIQKDCMNYIMANSPSHFRLLKTWFQLPLGNVNMVPVTTWQHCLGKDQVKSEKIQIT